MPPSHITSFVLVLCSLQSSFAVAVVFFYGVTQNTRYSSFLSIFSFVTDPQQKKNNENEPNNRKNLNYPHTKREQLSNS